MLVLPSTLSNNGLSIRPVRKEPDRPVIHQIFQREFYGGDPKPYSDLGLWEIYDKMDTRGAYGAYLVYQAEQVRFLIEVYPPEMMYFPDYALQEQDIGIYCFFLSINEAIDLPALSACVDALLQYPDIHRIITSFSPASPDEPGTTLLQKAGFVPRPESTERLSIYECTPESLLHSSLSS
jgi:hypothetical protein